MQVKQIENFIVYMFVNKLDTLILEKNIADEF